MHGAQTLSSVWDSLGYVLCTPALTQTAARWKLRLPSWFASPLPPHIFYPASFAPSLLKALLQYIKPYLRHKHSLDLPLNCDQCIQCISVLSRRWERVMMTSTISQHVHGKHFACIFLPKLMTNSISWVLWLSLHLQMRNLRLREDVICSWPHSL